MDRKAEACGASFLPSWPFFQCLSSAFRTDSFVLSICDPLIDIIDGETRLRRKGQRGNAKVGRFKARVCQTKGGNLSIWATKSPTGAASFVDASGRFGIIASASASSG